MEIKKSRYGEDRSYEKVDEKRIRVTGNSKFTRSSQNDNGEVTMYDFEGGPCFNLNAKIKYKFRDYKITKIQPLPSKYEGLAEVVLFVK
jgi:hypothetical protein